MKGHIPILSAFLSLLILNNASAHILLKIDPTVLCHGTIENRITLSMSNPFGRVAAIQVDILFDTDCFTLTDVKKTDRSVDMDIFHYASIEGGIRIAMTGIGHYIAKGTGPIVEVTVDIWDCWYGGYLWDVTGSIAADPFGSEILIREKDEYIPVAYCDPIVSLSSTEFDLGDIWIGHIGFDTLIVGNYGSIGTGITITSFGCAGADPTVFELDPGCSKKVAISCSPIEEGPCEGRIELWGGLGPDEVSVTCNGITPDSAVLSIDDRVVFKNTPNNILTLSLENIVPVAALQTDVLFDTTCFEVKSIKKTDRSKGMGIFHYAHIEGGIRIAMTCICNMIREGTGPIANIFVDVNDCPEGDYQWIVTKSKVADDVGAEVTATEIEGFATVLSCTKGDINNNGIIDILDVVLGIRIILELIADPTPRELAAADCNGDGQIDVIDVLGIVNVILEVGTCPP